MTVFHVLRRSLVPLWLALGAWLCAPSSALAQPMSTCPADNLVRRAPVDSAATKGRLARVKDGRLATEGTKWNAPPAVVLDGSQAHLDVDLGHEQSVQGLVLQADNNDAYVVEGSVDGAHFETLWKASAVKGAGLRTRSVRLSDYQIARYLRVRGLGGDGFYSVSELRAYCQLPEPWPPELKHPPQPPWWKKYGWHGIDNPSMVVIKGCIAALGTLLLLWGLWLRRRGREHRYQKTRDILLGSLGVLSLAGWWNLGHFHFDHYVHIWEHYHYYIGAKYAPELGYDGIYECTSAADLAAGYRKRVQERKIRDLRVTNELGSTDDIIADPSICTSRFSDERWKDFRSDIAYFRQRFSKDRWDRAQQDHGYNATPVWAIGARLLASSVTLSRDPDDKVWWARVFGKNNIWALAVIDSLLLLAMWGFVWWAFGWRAMCVALLWWGTNFPARFYWNGGSFLRYDWLFTLVVGVCLLKKNKPALGGAALTYSTLLRIFPGFVVAAVIVQTLAVMWRKRKFYLSRAHMRFAAGCLVAMAVLLPASAWAAGGFHPWVEFAKNSQKHLQTPLTNNMGLKTVLGFDYDTRAQVLRDDDLTDPYKVWKDTRREFYAKRAPLFAALILGFLLLLAKAVEREPDWVAAALGTGLIVIAAELTCYYYGFLLTYGLLWERRKLPGVLACATAGLTCLLYFVWGWNDQHFAAMSLATVLLVVVVTAHMAFRPTGAELLLQPAASGGRDPKGGRPEPQEPEPEPEPEPEEKEKKKKRKRKNEDGEQEEEKERGGSLPAPEPA